MNENYPTVISVSELSKILGVCKSSAYALLNGGRIKHVRVGRKHVIPLKSVVDFLDAGCYNEGTIVDGRQIQQSEKGEQL